MKWSARNRRCFIQKGLRRCWAAAHSTCHICPSINIFLLPPVLIIEYTPNPLFLEKRLYSSRYCVHKNTFTLEKLLKVIIALSNWARAHLFYNYGSCCTCTNSFQQYWNKMVQCLQLYILYCSRLHLSVLFCLFSRWAERVLWAELLTKVPYPAGLTGRASTIR